MVQVGDLFYVLRLLEGEEAPSSQDLIWVSLVFLSPTFDLKKSRTFKRHRTTQGWGQGQFCMLTPAQAGMWRRAPLFLAKTYQLFLPVFSRGPDS